ncbi:MAG: hypothetical protein D6824_07105 [Planctomycetota bacterium]|nr:MAG: hypothetical protein D6824_07105 [Planctomycetota bacterium]
MKHWLLTILWRSRHERGFVLRTLGRSAVAAVLAAVVLYAAWRTEPDSTMASDEAAAAQIAPAPGSMGLLVGLQATIELVPTPRGPRYTVRAADGTLLGERLTSDEVAALFPGLDPASGVAGLADVPLDFDEQP